MRGATVAATVVVGVCVAPSLAMNLWPRLSHMWASGAADGGGVAIVMFQTVAVLVMAACPFAMAKTKSRGFWWGALLFGIGLAGINFLNALEVASHLRDATSDPRRTTISRAATLRSDLGVAQNSRKQLSHFIWTTDEGVAAAKSAVASAEIARDQECGKIGENCRKRMADVSARQDELARAITKKALTDQATAINAKIAGIEKELSDLGTVPTHADPGAARLAKLLSLIVPMERPEDTVSEWWPIFLAGAVEALAMGGPRLLLVALAGENPTKDRQPPRRWTAWLRRRRDQATVAAPVATPARAAASATKPKRSKKSKPEHAILLGDVREFRDSRTLARPGNRIRCGQVYAAYAEWCRANGMEPVSLTAFGTQLKALGVVRENRNNRACYLDIGLTTAPRLAAITSQNLLASW
jgi:Poxvirus D5 protein-like